MLSSKMVWVCFERLCGSFIVVLMMLESVVVMSVIYCVEDVLKYESSRILCIVRISGMNFLKVFRWLCSGE